MVKFANMRARMRFSEMDSFTSSQLDFVPRERQKQVWGLLVAFMATIALVFVAGYLPLFKQMEVYTPLIAVILIMVLCIYVIYRKQISLDLVMSTEYQNMLFAQAVGLGSAFCFIVRRDGTIAYASDGLSSIFPHFHYGDSRALEGVFEQGIVRKADRERIMAAIRSGTNEHLVFPIFNQHSEKKDYILTVDPLPRPAGFSIVRAREYLGQRTGVQLLPDVLRSTSVDKLDHMLATTIVAHYTTDNYGRFEYVNPAFEHLFGYEPGEVVDSKLSIHHLFFSLGHHVLTEEYTLSDYTGEATLQHKDGSRLNMTVMQNIVRDAAGKVIGATGSIVAGTSR